jgi:hypothetical protein
VSLQNLTLCAGAVCDCHIVQTEQKHLTWIVDQILRAPSDTFFRYSAYIYYRLLKRLLAIAVVL